MNRSQITEAIQQICAEVLEIRSDELAISSSGQSLTERFGLNSVDALEVLLRIENTFDIEIDDEDLSLELLESVETLTDQVVKLMASEKAPSVAEAFNQRMPITDSSAAGMMSQPAKEVAGTEEFEVTVADGPNLSDGIKNSEAAANERGDDSVTVDSRRKDSAQ